MNSVADSFRFRLPIFLILVGAGGLTSLLKSMGIFAQQIAFTEYYVGGDKHLHLMVSTTLSFASVWCTPPQLRKFFAGLFGLPTLLLLILVISDETSQYFLPRREFSLLDMSVNITGVISGVVLFLFYEKVLKSEWFAKKDRG
jgi:polysaccharide biosynthesis protein VpsQ